MYLKTYVNVFLILVYFSNIKMDGVKILIICLIKFLDTLELSLYTFLK